MLERGHRQHRWELNSKATCSLSCACCVLRPPGLPPMLKGAPFAGAGCNNIGNFNSGDGNVGDNNPGSYNIGFGNLGGCNELLTIAWGYTVGMKWQGRAKRKDEYSATSPAAIDIYITSIYHEHPGMAEVRVPGPLASCCHLTLLSLAPLCRQWKCRRSQHW